MRFRDGEPSSSGLAPKACKRCGRVHLASDLGKHSTQYCSHRCEWGAKKAKKRTRSRCPQCHVEFYGHRSGPLICSAECRSARRRLWNRKRRAAIAAAARSCDHCERQVIAPRHKKSRLCARCYGLKDRAKKYGTTVEWIWERYRYQSGACSICRAAVEPEDLCVDHCHSTGAVRGLLCLGCNTGLGQFRDSEAFLESAAAYLKASRHLG